MCGRFTQQRPTSELARIFDADDLAADEGGRFNVAPTDQAAVVVQKADRRAIVGYRWGLIPHWADDPRIASRTFNARAESVASMPAFRDAFRRRRCIVPVDGFYEWRREGSVRQPFLIRRADGLPMALAGLWAGWRSPDGELRRTFTIVTTRPNELVATLHDRMPVALPGEAWSTWLDPELRDLGKLHALLVPAPAAELEMFPVQRFVNDVRRDGPELIEPLVG
jgi:putative SOS response-associated peptidase YedK